MVAMKIAEADELDSTWEQHESIFRVYFAKGHERTVTIVDVSGATFHEVRAWAQEESGADTLVAIALVGRDARGLKGLTWLLGMDPNDSPSTDIESRMYAEMTAGR